MTLIFDFSLLIKLRVLHIPFYKYQGAGNDFVILDQRTLNYLSDSDEQLIRMICDRKFGIGADGLMCIEPSENSDFKMVYYNADGRTSSMCGNGGRCIVALAAYLGIFPGSSCLFEAIDGMHKAKMHDDKSVSIEMIDVHQIEVVDGAYILNTGSPHFITFTEDDIENLDMKLLGREIRYNSRFKKEGINVNYVKKIDNSLHIRTYERGVEDETLACGTGVTAAVLAAAMNKPFDHEATIKVVAKGGVLNVSYKLRKSSFTDIWLTGPATFVFEGIYRL